MLDSNIKLRTTTHAPYETKGEELTWEELDGNQIAIADDVRALQTPGDGVAPFVDSTTYSEGKYVTYDSKLWRYINDTPAAGVVPVEGDDWTVASAGELTHVANTDTKLAEGTEFEVTAAQIHTVVGEDVAAVDSAYVFNEKGVQAWERRQMLPAIINFAGGTAATPPTENNGDIYILTDDFAYPNAVDTIVWQSGTAHTVKYTFLDFDLSHAAVGATAKVTGSTNPKHDGIFTIIAFDAGAGWIKVNNAQIANGSNDESTGTASVIITLAEWDGAVVNDWVRYDLAATRWRIIRPINGQTVLNINNKQTYVFKNNLWTSQAYVPPSPDTTKVVRIAHITLNANTTADQDIILAITDDPGFVKYYPTEIVMRYQSAAGSVALTTLDDFQIWDGPGRTGNLLFSTDNAAMIQMLNDTYAFISLSAGDITRETKTLANKHLYGSLGTAEGILSNFWFDMFGVPFQ